MVKGQTARFLVLAWLTAGCAAAVPPAPAPPRPVPPLDGAWEGTLEVAAGVRVRAVLHLVYAAPGWTATFDSPDQNSFGIPAKNVAVDAHHVRADVPDVPFSYDATVDGQHLLGTLVWKGRHYVLNLEHRAAVPAPVAAAPPATPPTAIEGAWAGALEISGIRLRLVVKIKPAGNSSGWTATLDSVDQHVQDIPVDEVTFSGGELKLALRGINATYAGRVAGTAMTGKWTQNGQAWPLDLHKTDRPPLAAARPQEPKRPLPYREVGVLVENRAAGVTLACTLTEPEGPGPFGGVVLVTGSGPQDRDEALLGHRPFFVLSDALTRAGLAVLRCDDRGVGRSTGNFATATTFDFVEDTLAELAELRARPEILPRRVGLLGHSEGAVVAPMAATRSKDVAFLVLLAGPAVPGDETIDLQRAWLERAAGLSAETIAHNKANWDRAFAILKEEKDPAGAEKSLRAQYDRLPEADRAQLESAGGFPAIAKQVLTPWFRAFIGIDPRKYLVKVRVPVLALNGQLDSQVLPAQNLPEMRKALRHDADVTVREMPGLNHLFQTAKTGAFSEYGEIEETMSPAVLTLVSGWVAAHAR
jgi:alpha-beta hydrolase superfamily lysophospholipase